ncbi:MAG: pilin [Pseudomonadales bacterium]|nr:pilin [Pseudomonadales bacterium]
MVAAASAKTSSSEFRLSQNRFPSNNATAGHSSSILTQNVRTVAIASGNITITFATNVVAGSSIIFRGTVANGQVVWTCSGGDLRNSYRPANCRG